MSFHRLILLWLTALIFASARDEPSISKPGCTALCGNVSLPYPFGIGAGCFLSPWYEINCSSSSHSTSPTPFLRPFNLELTQVDYNTTTGQPTLTAAIPFSLTEIWSGTGYDALQGASLNLTGSPYAFSMQHNLFMVRGCTGSAILMDQHGKVLAGCATICVNEGFVLSNSCYGVECCQTTIPYSLDFYKINLTLNLNGTGTYFASLIDTTSASKFLEYHFWTHFPAVLEWSAVDLQPSQQGIGNSVCERSSGNGGGYVCRCKSEFYQGNPYLPYGCQVVDGCEDCAGECIRVGNDSYTCPPRKKQSILPPTGVAGIRNRHFVAVVAAGQFLRVRMDKEKQGEKNQAQVFSLGMGVYS